MQSHITQSKLICKYFKYLNLGQHKPDIFYLTSFTLYNFAVSMHNCMLMYVVLHLCTLIFTVGVSPWWWPFKGCHMSEIV